MERTQSYRISQSDLIPRAIISGFVATISMTIAFAIGYAVAFLLAKAESGLYQQGALQARWSDSLIHNQAISLASNNLYAAFAVHFCIGLLWGVVYGYFVQPRLSGPGWQRGSLFALVPWILSLVVFSPLVGGGFFGLATNAGPLPTLSNLILHVVYGAVLGTTFELFDNDPDAEGGLSPVREIIVNLRSLKFSAGGILVGTFIGAVVGVLGVSTLQGTPDQDMLGLPSDLFFVASVLLGSSWGNLVGFFLA